MGNGFRRLRRLYEGDEQREREVGFSLENARFLAASRFLAKKPDLVDKNPPRIQALLPDVREGATFAELSCEVEDDRGLAAVQVYSPARGTVLGGAELGGR